MSRAIELTDEIKEHLEQYYPDEDFSNLYEASKALLEISRDSDENEDDGDEEGEVFDRVEYEERARPMDELDKVLLMEDRYTQMERALQIEERRHQKWVEDNEKINWADHDEHIGTITPQEIERQIAERVLQIKEKREIEAFLKLV